MKVISLKNVDSVFELERRLAQRDKKLTTISLEFIQHECERVERTPIVVRDSDGSVCEWVFMFGSLRKREPLFSKATTLVAVE